MANFGPMSATRTPSDVVVGQIVSTLVSRMHPRRIILIGSRARGDARPDSDYDVVVELDTDAATARERGREAYQYFPDRDWSLNVFARATGQIECSANDPGTVDWDIVRQGIVLYAADGVTSVLTPPPLRVREQPPEVPPSVADWTARAERDLAHARREAEMDDAWEYVCFHAQQAAEKYLKALLVHHYVRPRWIHDLKELLKDARKIGLELSGLDQDCAFLTPFAGEARYGPLVDFDETKGRAALAAADRIAAAVKPLLA